LFFVVVVEIGRDRDKIFLFFSLAQQKKRAGASFARDKEDETTRAFEKHELEEKGGYRRQWKESEASSREKLPAKKESDGEKEKTLFILPLFAHRPSSIVLRSPFFFLSRAASSLSLVLRSHLPPIPQRPCRYSEWLRTQTGSQK